MNDKIHETRYYNGVIQGHDEAQVYKVNFVSSKLYEKDTPNYYLEIEGGLREDGNINRWVESNVTWIAKWFPQILVDIAKDKVEGWRLN